MQENATDPAHTVGSCQNIAVQLTPGPPVPMPPLAPIPAPRGEARRVQDRRDQIALVEGTAIWQSIGAAVKQGVFVLGLFVLFQATPFGSNPALSEPQIYAVTYGLLWLLLYWPRHRRISEKAEAKIAAIYAPPKAPRAAELDLGKQEAPLSLPPRDDDPGRS
jgi:hypothetical protein